MKKVILLLAIVTTNAFSQNCESIISLSKTTQSILNDRDKVEQQAANFCSEYRKSVTTGSSMDAGGSYGIFSASVGMSNQSAEAVATKYCDSSNNYLSSKTVYKSYVESISPRAYQAYERCVEYSNNELKFFIEDSSILPDEFTISTSYISSGSASTQTRIDISPSKGVSCIADGQPTSFVDIKTGSTVAIKCTRTDSEKASYVTFTDRNSGKIKPLTLPWEATSKQGISRSEILALQQRIEGLENKVNRTASLSGIISLRAVSTRPITDSSACPSAPDAYRGEMNGHVTFFKAFVDEPTVSIGLNNLDIGSGINHGQRISINVKKVDKTGFDFSFFTFCDTAIAGATANWMAVSK